MKNFIKLLFSLYILLTSALVHSQVINSIVLKINETEKINLDEKLKKYNVYEINTQTLINGIKDKQKAKEYLEVRFILGKQYDWNIELFENDIYTENYQIKIATTNGVIIRKSKKTIAFEGYTDNLEEVRLTVAENFLSGFIDSNNERYFIEPLYNFVKSKADNLFVVYNERDVIKGPSGICLSESINEREKSLINNQKNNQNRDSRCFIVPIAIANDRSMFLRYGSNIGNVINQNIAIMNAVNTDYDDSFFCRDQIPNIGAFYINLCYL